MAKYFLLKILFLIAALNSYAQKSGIEMDTDSIVKYPNNPEFYFSRGFDYHLLKDNNAAIIDFSKAIKLSSKYADAYKWRALSYNDLNEFELAVKDFTRAISLTSKDMSLYFFRGQSYRELEKYDLAIADYSTIIRAAKNQFDVESMKWVWEATCFRGEVYQKLKKYDLAIDDFTKNIQTNPEDESSLWDRGNTYAYLEKFDLAIKDYRAVLEISPDNKQVQENLDRASAYNRNTTKINAGGKIYKIESDNIYQTITVTKGDILTITASGEVTLGGFAGSGGPEGIEGFTMYNKVQGFRHGSLLMQIGNNGSWQAVGTSKEIIAGRSGSLQFMVNDDDPSNNNGFFSVQISVKKK